MVASKFANVTPYPTPLRSKRWLIMTVGQVCALSPSCIESAVYLTVSRLKQPISYPVCPPLPNAFSMPRAHWSVENTCHWTLDVTFAEAASRVRRDNPPENFAVLRHLAFKLRKSHPDKA